MAKNTSGFTLIEMSIVVVVIGLIVGGVLVGTDLVKAAQIRSALSDIEKYKTAMYTFRMTYDALPGDMENASTFWSGANNGNGDRQIINPVSNTWTTGEILFFWDHLQLAGLVEGDGSTANVWEIPQSDLKDAYYYLRWDNYNGANRNSIYLSTKSASIYPNGAPFTALESWQIDAKADDGKAGTGNIIAMYGVDESGTWSGDCTNGSNWPGPDIYPPVEYDLTVADGVECRLRFKMIGYHDR